MTYLEDSKRVTVIQTAINGHYHVTSLGAKPIIDGGKLPETDVFGAISLAKQYFRDRGYSELVVIRHHHTSHDLKKFKGNEGNFHKKTKKTK